MIRAIAIDDEPNALRVIESLAAKVSWLRLVGTFVDPVKALHYLNENTIHLVFLDINMPDVSGLELSRIIQKREVSVIFTTAHSKYALESYEVEAVDYLLKPFVFTRFHAAVSKVRERIDSGSDFFFVSTGHEQRKILYCDIRYVEGSGNYVTYHLPDDKIMVRSTMKRVLAELPTTDFVQIQRSYVVSLAHIDKIQDNHVHIDRVRLSIGPKYKEQFKSIIEGFR